MHQHDAKLRFLQAKTHTNPHTLKPFFLHLALLLLGHTVLVAQTGPPASNIYLLPWQSDSNGLFKPGRPTLVNYDNFDQYDNQPVLFRGAWYFSSVRKAQQSDIMVYYPDINETFFVSNTLTRSEYSPTPMPDSMHLSVVVVTEDGHSQHLYQLNPVTGEETVLIDTFDNIGYHYWVTERDVVLFRVGEPHTLGVFNLRTKEYKPLDAHIGRCLQRSPRGDLSFVHNTDEPEVFICVYNFQTGQTSKIIPLLPESEDFIWLPDGSLLMGNGTGLYQFRPGKDQTWNLVGDFQKYGFKKITRLALGANGQLAIVDQL